MEILGAILGIIYSAWLQAKYFLDRVFIGKRPLLQIMDLKSWTKGKPAFTRLHARIREEDGAFTVNVRLQNHLKLEETAWGEEIAASFEMASLMIGALAEEFSIPQESISIEIRMEDHRTGTQH